MAYGVNAPFGLRPLSSIDGGSWTEKTNEYFIYADAAGTTTYGTSIFSGDPVVFNPSNDQAGTIARYLPAYANGTPSTFSTLPIVGVFQSCEYTNTTGNLVLSPYWPANTQVQAGSKIKAYVLDDPSTIFDVQVSTSIDANAEAFVANPVFPNTNATADLNGSFGSNFALNIGGGTNFDTVQVGGVANIYANNPAGGDTRTGQSGFYLDVQTNTGGDATHDYNKTTATLPLKAIGFTLSPKNKPRLVDQTMETTPFLNVRVLINNHYYKAGTLGTTLSA